MYYKLVFEKEKNIPIPLAFVAFFILVLIAVLIKKNFNNNFDKMNVGVVKFEIGNLTESSATLFWRTSERGIGYISLEKKSSRAKAVYYDIRDTEDFQTSRFNHIVDITNLSPNSTYIYTIFHNKKQLPVQGEFKTPAKIIREIREPIYGVVEEISNNLVKEAVVVVYIKGAFPIISTTKSDGSFLISLCCIKRPGKSMVLSPDTLFSLEVISEEGKIFKQKESIKNATPFKNKLSFLTGLENNVSTTKNFQEENGKILGFKQKIREIDIIFPSEDAIIPGARPLFKGKAIPGNLIQIAVYSSSGNRIVNNYNIHADKDGIWMMTPPEILSPGEYILNLTTKDKNENEIKLKRSFKITKSGESVLGVATPNAVITATATPTVFQTFPTEPPFEEVVISPTIFITMPPSGFGNTSSLSLISVALILVGAGLIFIF